jgi:aspartate/tyrosine/aromatic aminotransferase
LRVKIAVIEERIKDVLSHVSKYIDKSDAAEVLSLVETHGEFGIALETLSSILEEEEIPVSIQIFNEIMSIFCDMGFEKEDLSYYKENLKIENG